MFRGLYAIFREVLCWLCESESIQLPSLGGLLVRTDFVGCTQFTQVLVFWSNAVAVFHLGLWHELRFSLHSNLREPLSLVLVSPVYSGFLRSPSVGLSSIDSFVSVMFMSTIPPERLDHFLMEMGWENSLVANNSKPSLLSAPSLMEIPQCVNMCVWRCQHRV